MPETITATSCPEHVLCVVRYHTVPIKELGTRTPLALTHEHQEWLNARQAAALEVDHVPTTLEPEGLLVGDVEIAPRDIATRLGHLDAEVARLTGQLDGLEARFQVLHDRVFAEIALHDSIHASARMTEKAVTEAQALLHKDARKRLARLESFSTRRKRWKKEWEKPTDG